MKLLDDPQCRGEILARLEQVRPESLRRWGKMSAPQMICHLRDAFLGVTGDLPMVIPSGFSWWRLTKPFAFYSPFPWPHGVPTRPEFDQLGGTCTPPVQFEADMGSLFAAIARFTTQPRAFIFRPHPLFGDLSEHEWMIWGYRHADHHLRQFGK